MPTLREAIDRFLKLKKATGRAQSTLKWYEGLLNILAQHFGDVALDSISDEMMIDYLVDCRDRMSPDGADSYTRAFKSFWGWSAKRYEIADPMHEIDYPQARKTPVEPMSIDTFKKLFDVAYQRDKAMLLFLLATGARISEMLQMKVADIDSPNRRVRVKGKGAKYRYLTWDDMTHGYLTRWIGNRPSINGVYSEYVWVSHNTGKVLSRNGVYQALRYLKERAGVEDRVHPHAIRHLSATLKAQSGMGTEVLRRKLGHENTKTTQRYMQISDIELDISDRKHNPVQQIFDDDESL